MIYFSWMSFYLAKRRRRRYAMGLTGGEYFRKVELPKLLILPALMMLSFLSIIIENIANGIIINPMSTIPFIPVLIPIVFGLWIIPKMNRKRKADWERYKAEKKAIYEYGSGRYKRAKDFRVLDW